jgi:hypothetical protein
VSNLDCIAYSSFATMNGTIISSQNHHPKKFDNNNLTLKKER